MKQLLSFILISFSLIDANGQAVVLQKKEAVNQALTENNQLQIATNDIATAEAKYKQTDAVFLPRLSVDYTAMVTNNPLNAFGFKLQQQSITQSDFAPNLLNNPSATGDFSAKASLMQPIFNADMLAMRKAAQKQVAIAGFKKQRTQDYIRFSVETAYNQLQMAYEMQRVANDALQTLQATYKWVKDRYDQGYVQKSDLLNVEVQIKAIETQIATAGSAIAEYSDNLSVLMGKPIGTLYTTDSLEMDLNPYETTIIPDTRNDYKAMETAILAYDDMMKSTKRTMIPKVNGFALYQFNDKNAFGFGSNAYLAGLQLTWNIFQGNEAHSKLNTQKLEQKQIVLQLKNQKEEDTKALAKAHQQLSNADFQLRQYKAAVTQAQEALTILQNRLQQGLVGTTDVLQAHTQLAQQKMFYNQAVTMHNSTLAYIRFLTAQ
ncbi:MAG: TolC family protein [Chitinophagaceae bacterium]|nr:TolC family protein [Chitinophagaceae bacterium]